jgi:hypothetical protein
MCTYFVKASGKILPLQWPPTLCSDMLVCRGRGYFRPHRSRFIICPIHKIPDSVGFSNHFIRHFGVRTWEAGRRGGPGGGGEGARILIEKSFKLVDKHAYLQD